MGHQDAHQCADPAQHGANLADDFVLAIVRRMDDGLRKLRQVLQTGLERCDGIRKPARFDEILLACECDARGRLGFDEAPYPQRQRLSEALAAVQSVATRVIAARAAESGVTGQKVGEMIHAARVRAVAAWLLTTAAD